MKNSIPILSVIIGIVACSSPDVSSVPSGPLMSGTRKLVWADEFEKPGLPNSAKWKYDVGADGWGNNELQYYSALRPENARIENDKLIIEARREEYQGALYYTSARLSTQGKASWTNGRIEVSAKLPRGRGTWACIWMLGNDYTSYSSWPKCGEIDIMEHVGFDEGKVHGSLHTLNYNHLKSNQKTKYFHVSDATTNFHVYAIEWTSDQIDFYVDDSKYYTAKKTDLGVSEAQWPFDKPFFIILNIAVGGNWGGQKGIDDTIWPQRMEVDYVRVFQ
ncbi:glycoside hydrolase family 16 protein [Larkinella sp. VNQ87]|uniref:glycoside hydrolase family 16 protein n=1 Tax=Larkinella sp. VNQ87 TaxID=3400921 RepID=UPI003C04CA2A